MLLKSLLDDLHTCSTI